MLKYRRIEAVDDDAIARIIRSNLEKLHLNIHYFLFRHHILFH